MKLRNIIKYTGYVLSCRSSVVLHVRDAPCMRAAKIRKGSQLRLTRLSFHDTRLPSTPYTSALWRRQRGKIAVCRGWTERGRRVPFRASSRNSAREAEEEGGCTWAFHLSVTRTTWSFIVCSHFREVKHNDKGNGMTEERLECSWREWISKRHKVA